MKGDVCQIIKGGKGYALVSAAAVDAWEAHQPELGAMVNIIKLGAGAASTPTPTRKPTPKRATPTRKPTATATAEATPTEEAGTPAAPDATFITASRAYELALPAAQSWNEASTMIGMECAEWNATAYSPGVDAAVTVRARNGQAGEPEETSKHRTAPIRGEWPDSPAVVAAAKTTPDYRAFADLFPSGAWDLGLTGSEQAGYQWSVMATAGQVSVTLSGDALPAVPAPSAATLAQRPATPGAATFTACCRA
jgi:hypothetical protein